MLSRQLLPVFAALAIFFTFTLGGAWLEFILRYLVMPALVLLLAGLAVSLFIAFLMPRR